MTLVLALIVIGGLLIFFLILNQKSKKKKKAIQAQKKLEMDRYDRYMRRFDDPSCLTKLEPTSSKVAGTRYANDDTGENRQTILKATKEGELLMLIPDELNRYDNAAIKIMRLNGKQIGFLDMDASLEIKSRLINRSPVEAKVSKIYEKGGVLECDIELQRYSRKIKKQ
ncbi:MULTISPECIES: HIRAN domain-containing protein [Flammeovirga]|uniref:HIRAN domain-containing protein n=1 Tax=Flammeovirga agarivorans TaxID=2726742 RepID=A0A7X8SLQ7_9BACT|nr:MULTISPECIES: HIRAN domain-containing protein [Flammeovirga]NLR92556.1 hypothetical protein [Flammeovirga agarivorans]